MNQLNMRLTTKDRERIEQLAKVRGVNMTQAVLAAVEEQLDRALLGPAIRKTYELYGRNAYRLEIKSPEDVLYAIAQLETKDPEIIREMKVILKDVEGCG